MLGLLDGFESRCLADIGGNALERRVRDYGTRVVQHELLYRRCRLGGERHAHQAAERRAHPVDGVNVEPRDESHHVGDVLRQRVKHRIGQALRFAAACEIGADDPELLGERACELVEVARGSSEPVNADEDVAISRIAPLEITDAVQAFR